MIVMIFLALRDGALPSNCKAGREPCPEPLPGGAIGFTVDIAELDAWRSKGLLPSLKSADAERASVLCLSMMTDGTRIATALGQPPSLAEIESKVGFAFDIFLRGCGYQMETEVRSRRS